MKKLLVIALALAFLIAVSTVVMAKDTPANDKGQSGKSNIGQPCTSMRRTATGI